MPFNLPEPEAEGFVLPEPEKKKPIPKLTRAIGETVTGLYIAGGASREALTNLFKRIAGAPIGGIGPGIPFQEKFEMQQLAETLRETQTLPQNIGAGITQAAPYLIPGAGQALFAADIATQPQHIPEQLKAIGQTFKDVRAVADPFIQAGPLKAVVPKKTEVERAEAKERFRRQPVESLFSLALPASVFVGGIKGGAKLLPKPKPKLAVVPKVEVKPAIVGKGKAGEQILIEKGLEFTKPKPEPTIPPPVKTTAAPGEVARPVVQPKTKFAKGEEPTIPEKPVIPKPEPPPKPPPIPKVEVRDAITGIGKKGEPIAFEAPKPRVATPKKLAVPPPIVPPSGKGIELGAVATPETVKALGKTVSKVKITPDFIKPARKRVKSEVGQEQIRSIEKADEVWQGYRGRYFEQTRELGLRKIRKETDAIALSKRIEEGKEPGYKKLFDDIFKEAEKVGLKLGRIEKAKHGVEYLPRRWKQEVSERVFGDVESLVQKLEAGSFSDKAIAQMVSEKAKAETKAIINHLVSKGSSYKKAIENLRTMAQGEIFTQISAEKTRRLDLPSWVYERDARKLIPEYISDMSQRIAEVKTFGQGEKLWRTRQRKLAETDFKEAEVTKTLLDMWSGRFEMEKGLRGKARIASNLFFGFQTGTKIGLGTATIPNVSQTLISTLPDLGAWNTVKGGLRLLSKEGRREARLSGALNNSALLTFGGLEPTGVMRRFSHIATKVSGFQTINRFNQYLAASSFESAVGGWHRQARGGRKWAQKRLGDFNIDYKKPLTQKIVHEGMYRFATDAQLQRNVLNDPLMFNNPKLRPLFLFKRFGYRQAVFMKDMLKREFKRGNAMPMIRLLIGGIAGGEGVILAKNWVREFISGEAQYREEDWKSFERYAQDIASVGAFGVMSDIMQIDKISRIWGSLKFAVTPVAVADMELIYKAGEKVFKDLDVRDFSDVVRRQSPELLGFAGSLPRYLKQRLITKQQRTARNRFFRGRKRSEILDLILKGDGEDAQRKLRLWNENFGREVTVVDGKLRSRGFTSEDINWKELKNRAIRKAKLGHTK